MAEKEARRAEREARKEAKAEAAEAKAREKEEERRAKEEAKAQRARGVVERGRDGERQSGTPQQMERQSGEPNHSQTSDWGTMARYGGWTLGRGMAVTEERHTDLTKQATPPAGLW